MKKCDVICGHVKAKSVSKKNSCKSQLLSLQSKDFPLHKFAFFHDLNLKKHAIMFFCHYYCIFRNYEHNTIYIIIK